MTGLLRLGVNIDHVATLRNARGGAHPDPLRLARLAAEAGAQGLTIHLREDRRHITDADLEAIATEAPLPVNLEMAATAEMQAIALAKKPHACCIVPERREERTTESGLDAIRLGSKLTDLVGALRDTGLRVSLVLDADPAQLEAAAAAGADCVELHTGTYADTEGAARAAELTRLETGARLLGQLGLECHAGHGLTYDNVPPIARLPGVVELNIGHFLIGEALVLGFVPAVRRMREAMDAARAGT